jgi:hypothetical protein
MRERETIMERDGDRDELRPRDVRRYQLALRLMAHQARTRTISAMTSLSRHQLATLRRRWRVTQEMRYPGPSPRSLAAFLHSPQARSEGALLAVLCRALKILPGRSRTEAGRGFLSLESGEGLCELYEAYRACFPGSELEFEEVLSLIRGLAESEVIELGSCGACGATILIDRLATHRHRCTYCQTIERRAESQTLVSGSELQDPNSAVVQNSLL